MSKRVASKGAYSVYREPPRNSEAVEQFEVWDEDTLISTHAYKTDAVAKMNDLAGVKQKQDRTAMPKNGGGKWNVFQ